MLPFVLAAESDKRLLDHLDHSFEKPGYRYNHSEVDGNTSQFLIDKSENNTKIKTTIEPLKSLKDLELRIKKLEANLQMIDEKVLQDQQEIVHKMKLDNLVVLEISIDSNEYSKIEELEVKLDGFPLVESKNFLELWFPNNKLMFYRGALTNGKHRVELSARSVLMDADAIPLVSGPYQKINKAFEINIEGNNSKKKWIFNFELPKNKDQNLEVKLSESKIN